MIQFQENTQTDSRVAGWTDPISGGVTSTTAIDWHLKIS